MDTIRYIIVVHGIGEQRKNETVLSVVNRFAEARRGLKQDKKSNILTLGRATGQTGKDDFLNPCRYPGPPEPFPPWMEFEGIPQDSKIKPGKPFYGEPSESGNNLRFVDLCWSDIMQSDWPHVGQKTEIWTKSLLGRLRKNYSGEAKYKWIIVALEKLVETLLLVKKITAFRIKKMEELIFNKFLGDVQLYGEYSRTRGKGVRRFHKLMARIEHDHYKIHGKNAEARYTVIAHSLGSIMSLDALTYAHVDRNIRQNPGPNNHPNLPFPGYCQENLEQIQAAENEINQLQNEASLTASEKNQLEEAQNKINYLNTGWVKRVDSFVTLGSPIDKFLIMWWLNYKYLDSADWCTNWDTLRKEKILHLNYCDEQDPVGHELDVVEKKPAYSQIFCKKEDRVFNRYPVPGAAHNEYWSDLDLFKRILHWAVDNPTTNQSETNSFTWFDKNVYKRVLRINYKIIPWAIVFADYFVFTWAMYAKEKHIAALASLAALAVWYLGRQVIDLLIYWRQIQMAKSEKRWTKMGEPQANMGERQAYEDRESARKWFRRRLKWVPALCLVLAGISLAVYGHFIKDHLFQANHLVQINFLIFIAVFVALIALKVFSNFKKVEEEADSIQSENDFWQINSWVGLCLLLSVLLAWGVSTQDEFIKLMITLSTQPNIWFNLTVFWMIAGAVFTYQTFRHSKARQDLNLTGRQEEPPPDDTAVDDTAVNEP